MSWSDRVTRAVVPGDRSIRRRVRMGPRGVGIVARAARVGALVFLSVLAGCGFHLRGQANYSFKSIFVSSPPGIPFTSELRRSVEGAGGVPLAAAADQAEVVLEVNSVTEDKEVLSLSSGGRVAEFLLSTRVMFRVHDHVGNDWLPTSEVLIRRSYTYNDTEALAKEAQEQRLRREMQSDAVQQIVRRLEAAHKPA